VLLRMLLLHVARSYSLRETVVRAKLANWTDISDVALLKRLRNSEEWLRLLCKLMPGSFSAGRYYTSLSVADLGDGGRPGRARSWVISLFGPDQ
jgi:hypothetical protein